MYVKKIGCIPNLVLGFSFEICGWSIAVESPWGDKVDLPKIDCNMLTWVIQVFENL